MAKRVLIVDDSKFSRVNFRKMVEKFGFYVVAEAVDGFDALEKLQHNEIDLIVTDLEMPNLDGLAMIKEIRKTGSDVDIIVISSVVTATMVQEVFRYNATVIKKPIKEEMFLNALNSLKK